MPDIITIPRAAISDHRRLAQLSQAQPETVGHIVQFYRDATFLAESISRVAYRILAGDGAAVLIATASHLRLIEDNLIRRQLDLNLLRASRRYVALDAQDMLAHLTMNERLDGERLSKIVGKVVGRVGGDNPSRHIFVFGELVALLCAAGRPDAAVRLEQLWNSLLKQYRFSLWCAYALHNFHTAAALAAVFKICAEHRLTIPAETVA